MGINLEDLAFADAHPTRLLILQLSDKMNNSQRGAQEHSPASLVPRNDRDIRPLRRQNLGQRQA